MNVNDKSIELSMVKTVHEIPSRINDPSEHTLGIKVFFTNWIQGL